MSFWYRDRRFRDGDRSFRTSPEIGHGRPEYPASNRQGTYHAQAEHKSRHAEGPFFANLLEAPGVPEPHSDSKPRTKLRSELVAPRRLRLPQFQPATVAERDD